MTDLFEVPSADFTVTLVLDVTREVVALKVPEVWPAAMVIEAGTRREVFELVRVTVAPAAGAGPERVTVPLVDLPPTTGVPTLSAWTLGVGRGVKVATRVRFALAVKV